MSLLDRRIRGFRLVDAVALALLFGLVLSVYLAKTIAGSERTEIAKVERQIVAEKARMRLLRAELAHLEQPARIGHLASAYLKLEPLSSKRETTPEALATEIAAANVQANAQIQARAAAAVVAMNGTVGQ